MANVSSPDVPLDVDASVSLATGRTLTVSNPATAVAGVPDPELLGLYEAYQFALTQHDLYDTEGRFWWARQLLREGQTLWGWPHCVQQEGITQQAIEIGAMQVEPDRRRPGRAGTGAQPRWRVCIIAVPRVLVSICPRSPRRMKLCLARTALTS